MKNHSYNWYRTNKSENNKKTINRKIPKKTNRFAKNQINCCARFEIFSNFNLISTIFWFWWQTKKHYRFITFQYNNNNNVKIPTHTFAFLLFYNISHAEINSIYPPPKYHIYRHLHQFCYQLFYKSYRFQYFIQINPIHWTHLNGVNHKSNCH